MNCLAHLQLADHQSHALAGALLGDFVKGNLADHRDDQGGDYSVAWVRSIRFHRQIDAFTDSHPLVHRARQRFERPFRRYAGIIVDLMFDHFLVREWGCYSRQPLAEFEQYCYQQLQSDEANFPDAGLALSQFLRKHQLLSGYGDLTIIDRALAGVGRRLSRDNPLDQCLPAISSVADQLLEDFVEFYPLLQLACADFEVEATSPLPVAATILCV